MKTTHLILPLLAAAGLTACDQAKEAAAKTEAAAKEAVAKAEAAAPGLKEKAASALESAKDAGAGALDKGKELLGDAADWTKQKLGIPEADGLLEGFKSLFDEAKTSIKEGLTGEKAAALKAKWDELYSKAADSMKNMAPEQQEKLKGILTTIKAKWDELLAKGQEKAGS